MAEPRRVSFFWSFAVPLINLILHIIACIRFLDVPHDSEMELIGP